MTAERGRRASILIVDDTVDNLQLMTGMLTQQGYEARPVPSGKLALQAVANDSPDLILLDITMPGMSGYEVARLVRARAGSAVRIVALSGFALPEDRARALEAGFDQHMVKPVDQAFLRSLLGG
jgi:two-component system, sensor histidine kinase